MYCDNKAFLPYCFANNVNIPDTKHIDIRFSLCQEHVEIGVIESLLCQYDSINGRTSSLKLLAEIELKFDQQSWECEKKSWTSEKAETRLRWLGSLVAPANRLKIGKCNLRLSSDITSKEATLQVIYDVLKINPFLQGALQPQYFRENASIMPYNLVFRKFEDTPFVARNSPISRDDPMFTTINVISRHEDTQLYGAILPKELTNKDIRNSESYKEYYAIASGEVPPKTKASVHK
ncbi:hypothetical protein Tco_0389525 [Tanacetum coccineum]